MSAARRSICNCLRRMRADWMGARPTLTGYQESPDGCHPEEPAAVGRRICCVAGQPKQQICLRSEGLFPKDRAVNPL